MGLAKTVKDLRKDLEKLKFFRVQVLAIVGVVTFIVNPLVVYLCR